MQPGVWQRPFLIWSSQVSVLMMWHGAHLASFSCTLEESISADGMTVDPDACGDMGEVLSLLSFSVLNTVSVERMLLGDDHTMCGIGAVSICAITATTEFEASAAAEFEASATAKLEASAASKLEAFAISELEASAVELEASAIAELEASAIAELEASVCMA